MKIRKSTAYDMKNIWVAGAIFPLLAWLFVSIVGVSEAGWWQVLIFLAASGGAFAAWRAIDWGGDLGRFVSLGAVVLLALAANHLLFAIDVIIAGPRFWEWPVSSMSPEKELFKAEIISTSGVFITVSAWVLAGGKRIKPDHLFKMDRALVEKALALLYVGAIFIIAMQLLQIGALSALGQLAPTLAGMATVAALALPLIRFRRRLPRLIYSAVLSAPVMYFALGSGMKEELILAAFPIAFILWTSWKTPLERMLTILAALLFLGAITTYVGFYRDTVWRTNAETSQADAVKEFAFTAEREGLVGTFIEGLEGFTDRANASNYRAWAVTIADQRGHYPEMVFDPLLFVFVPRILWPEKPAIRQGWEFTGLVYGERFQNMLTTSTAAGFYPALYLGGGYSAVLLGAILMGIILAVLARLAHWLGGSLFSSIFLLSLLPFALRLEEQWTVMALSAPIIMFVYTYVVYLMVLLVARVRGKRRSTSAEYHFYGREKALEHLRKFPGGPT